LANSDILYFNLADSPVFKYGISSNKLFDYMAAGRVVIFSSNAVNNPIKEANGGFTIQPDNPLLLANTIKEIVSIEYEKMVEIGARNRDYCEKYYSIPLLVDKLEKILNVEVNNG
jgi:glycosyltransferase involved in cell wall biosynthesis